MKEIVTSIEDVNEIGLVSVPTDCSSVSVSDVLRWVYLRVISNIDCAKSFATGTVLNTIICAEFFNVTSQSACQGDFGGPLVHVASDGIPTLIGLFVFTTSEDNACPRGLPTGYTRPGPYLPWFQQITGLNFENLQEEDDEEDDDTTTPSSSTTITTTDFTPEEGTTAPPNDSEEQEPDGFTPEENTTTPPDDSEDQEEDKEDEEEEDSDSSESSEDDNVAQLLKRLEVNVKVKVGFNKYNVSKAEGMEVNHYKH